MKYCPRCLRTESATASCPNEDFPGMNCPPLVDEDPAKDITLACGPCELEAIVPVRELLSGAAKSKLPSCKRDVCACVVVPREKAPAGDLDPVMPELRALAEKAPEVKAAAKQGKAKSKVLPEEAQVTTPPAE